MCAFLRGHMPRQTDLPSDLYLMMLLMHAEQLGVLIDAEMKWSWPGTIIMCKSLK